MTPFSDTVVVPPIEDLYGIFGCPAPRARTLEPGATPEPYRSLLEHNSHMTVTLERHHGTRTALVVLESHLVGSSYARKILLLHSETRRVVQFGIMRFELGVCDDGVRREILEQRTPLGRILIEHDVLRRVDLQRLVAIEPDDELRRHFALAAGSREPVYGRLATIQCNEQPCVDLLEVVAP